MVCSEGQPCKVSETPNTDFDSIKMNQSFHSLWKAQVQVLRVYDPYSYLYSEDQEEYLEDRQDMMEDAEYE
jgi:hypothetical protein